VGNLTHTDNAVTGEAISYGYDALDRLVAASGAVAESYSYDQVGDLTTKNGQAYSYPAPGSAHPHAVVAANGTSYGYDANGSLTKRGTQTIAYDPARRPVRVTAGGTICRFVHDGDGIRRKRLDQTGTIHYAGGYENNLGNGQTTARVVTKYYMALGRLVARRKNEVLSYIGTDHLGDTIKATTLASPQWVRCAVRPLIDRVSTRGPSLLSLPSMNPLPQPSPNCVVHHLPPVLLLTWGVGLILLLGGCFMWGAAVGRPTTHEPLVSRSAVRFLAGPPDGALDNPVWWQATQEVVVSLFPFPPPGRSVGHDVGKLHLYTRELGDSDWHKLPVPPDPDCPLADELYPLPLTDGRLAYLQRCGNTGTMTRPIPQQASTIMTYDPQTGQVASFRPYHLHMASRLFAVAPDLQLGLINDGHGLAEGLDQIGPTSVEPLHLPLARAGFPVWAPNGQLVALDGAQDDHGAQGIGRLDLPRVLYLMTPSDWHLHPLVSGIREAGAAAWSPNSRWLALSMELANGEKGLWLVEVATGKLHLVLGIDGVGEAAWGPDGASLIAIAGLNADVRTPRPTEIGLYVIDLPDLSTLATPGA